MSESSGKVGELVGEIAAASNEQAQGIEQVNKAVTEMDKVTQQNAAGAEESASASEEMNAQAEQMKAVVGELMKLVGGRRHVEDESRSKGMPARAAAPRQAPGAPKHHRRQKALPAAPAGGRKVNPDDVIPMDDDNFTDF